MKENNDHLLGDRNELNNNGKSPHSNLHQFKLVVELAKKGCPSFYPAFAFIYPEFDKKLRGSAPCLKLEDLAICAYTKLGFRTLQIAYFINTSDRAIDSRKYRIRKKLNVPKGSDFRKFIFNF